MAVTPAATADDGLNELQHGGRGDCLAHRVRHHRGGRIQWAEARNARPSGGVIEDDVLGRNNEILNPGAFESRTRVSMRERTALALGDPRSSIVGRHAMTVTLSIANMAMGNGGKAMYMWTHR